MENIKEKNWQIIIAIIATIGLVATLIMVFIAIYQFNQRIDGLNTSVNQNLSGVNQRIDGLNTSVNQNLSGVSQRIDGVYAVLIKSDKGIVEMKTEIEARFGSIEKRLATIETGISSLQPRDNSLKGGESGPKTSPYQGGESGPKTTPYQSP